jgi:ABC-type Zn uptake system ZnuABC Zn-binding protein ZnuA
LELSALDANYKSMYENANSTIIVTSSDIFKFLEKYNFTVLSLEENSNLNTKLIADVKALINAGTVKYIYIKSDETVSKTVQSLLDTTSVKVLEINTISMITQVQRDNKENYISIMENNLLQYQMEVYK